MGSKCYDECYTKLKISALANMKHAPNQLKGRMWVAIGTEEKEMPKMHGPIRYNTVHGLQIYEQHIKTKLTKEITKTVDGYMAKDLDFMIFSHADHECASIFEE
jgi:hypothetical protein